MTDQSRPLVTIGIPTYNRADSYLKDALESALAQTYPSLEIVVSDNCSVDHTEELVRSYHDPRIRYFRQERNLGLLGNLNFCVEQARGAYFLLLCDDDLIDPDFVETCMDAAGDRTDIGLIRTGLRLIDDDGEVVKERRNQAVGLSTKELFAAWFEGGRVTMHPPSTLLNTEGLREVGGYSTEKGHFSDVVAQVLLFPKYERLDLEDAKASFRIHPDKSTAAAKIEDWCIESLYLFDLILDLAGDGDQGFRRAGSRFFTGQCLKYARSVPSFPERLRAYRTVYRSFDHSGPVFLRAFVTRPASSFLRRGVRRLRRLTERGFGLIRAPDPPPASGGG